MPEFTARFATDTEIASWDELVTGSPGGGNLLQSEAFAAVKADYGWGIRHVAFQSAAYTSYNLLLEKRFPVLGRLWYLIKGPNTADVRDIPAMMTAVKAFVRRERLDVFALKIEPDVVDSPEARAVLAGAGLRKTPDLQPNDHTAVLDIQPEANQLLRALHSRGRNAVRRAQREGVQVIRKDPDEAAMADMYALMRGTIAAKSTNQVREFAYYRRFWSEFAARNQGRFYFVYENGVPSVGAYVINYGAKATYKDGGSLQQRSQYGDSHLVQWTAIADMKDLGAREYDFCGTPPADRLKDSTHPFHGLGLFKTSFTKTVTDFVGCYDLVLAPLAYRAWTAAGERIFRRLYTRRTGQQFY